jgi:hypothetical protein
LRKLFVCAALLCVAFARASGQGDGVPEGATPSFVRLGDAGAEAARLLKSDEKRARAWGAYLVGLHRLKGQAPSLVSILEDESLNGFGLEESAVRQAALDALIRLDAEVPSETLLSLYTSAPDEVLILLARSPETNGRALLTLFDEEGRNNVRWLAAGNLLAETRAQGFAARLLGSLKIEAGVYVFDREGEHQPFGRGMNGGGGCGHGGTGLDRDFPPVGYYDLDDTARRGVILLARGPHDIYYTRSPNPTSCPSTADWFDRDSLRIEYVDRLLRGAAEVTNFDETFSQRVACRDEAQCRKALAGARDRIRRAYDALVRRLLDEGLLDGAEAAALKPDITLDITDMRERKSFPLPGKLRGAKLTFTSYDAEGEPPTPAPR